MSSRPIDPNAAFELLRTEGFEVEIHQQHLLVHNIPYVTPQKVVRNASLACLYIENGEQVIAPDSGKGDNHQVWWTGEYPCYPDGTRLDLGTAPQGRELFPGLTVQHQFSNKPFGASGFPDHYTKVTHYIRLIQNQAKAIDRDVDARTGRVLATQEDESVFCYPDTASARSEILAISAKLAASRIAIVGLGGTGSYILDQTAKTPVGEIHLFDGDIFNSHNAFRAPGAASLDEINAKEPKTDYFARKYAPMRRHVISHPYFIDPENVHELAGLDFVFVCVDKGVARSLIATFLIDNSIPFVDVGMNLLLLPEQNSLMGTCRATLVTPEKSDHVADFIPMDSDEEEDVLYRQNLQVADMNAVNAMLGVIKWKQHLGFYQDDTRPHNLSFAVNLMSLNRSPRRPEHSE